MALIRVVAPRGDMSAEIRMIQLIVVGLWIVGATLGATYGGAYWRSHASSSYDSESSPKLSVHPIKVITVPIIENGGLRGYISAEFSFVGVAHDPHDAGLDPESFIQDEAFRMIYSNRKLDFMNIQKDDLSELTREIVEKVNARIGKSVVKEMLVRNFNFIAREDVPK